MIPNQTFLQVTILTIIANAPEETISPQDILKILKEKYQYKESQNKFFGAMSKLAIQNLVITNRTRRPLDSVINTKWFSPKRPPKFIIHLEYTLSKTGFTTLTDIYAFNVSLTERS